MITTLTGTLNGRQVTAEILLYRSRFDLEPKCRRWRIKLADIEGHVLECFPCPYEAWPEQEVVARATLFLQQLGFS